MTHIEPLDVVIVGAGLSGIDAAYRLQTMCPDRSYAIVEARAAIGGTWELFRYPGIRSDTDMATLGFPFHPWRGPDAIAGGAAIRDYIEATAATFGIDRRIRFRHRLVHAEWSSRDARWTLDLAVAGETRRLSCRFLVMGSGYYDHDAGHAPAFPDQDRFAGRIVHPQHWPDDLDVAGKRIVVIGSGATAVTLIPALIPAAGHVTMLQRSPSYIVAMPREDRVATAIRRWLPQRLADRAVRWKSALLGNYFYSVARRRPERVRQLILAGVEQALGPGHDIARDHTPAYDPWDERVCLAPDGDLFAAIRSGAASVVTGTIDRFVPDGIALASGRLVPADIIVTATGLNVRLLGGATLSVDGEPASLAGRMIHRGVLVAGIPNLAILFGYTNASWTLRCDVSARYVCRLLNHMAAKRMDSVESAAADDAGKATLFDLRSSYIRRAANELPRAGAALPWRVRQNYLLDRLDMRGAWLDDPHLIYRRAGEARIVPVAGSAHASSGDPAIHSSSVIA